MVEVDEGTIPCGMRALPIHDGIICHLAVINDFMWLSKSGPTSVVATSWWGLHLPIHSIWRMSIIFYIFDMEVWTIPCGIISSTTAMVSSDTQQSSMISVDFPNRVLQGGGNSMMGAPYPHPQYMKYVNPLLYVWNGSGNHSMWDESLSHCMMISFVSQ
jgi:hypothetical protein